MSRAVDVGRGKQSASKALRDTGVEVGEKAAAMTGAGGLRAVVAGAALTGAIVAAQGGDASDVARGAAIGAGAGAAAAFLGKTIGLLRRCACFAAGTGVHVDGGLKPIEQVAVGDLVWARNIYTDAVELRPVLAVFVRIAAPIVDVVVAGPDGEQETLRTTAEHPFWTQRGWVEVADLQPGDTVHLGGRGRGTVVSLEPTGQHETVYNFAVGEFHTYYIGKLATLVHNCGKVYKVDGSNTPSGKPYVGRTKQSSPARRGKRDGRDRKDAKIVDTYDEGDTAAGRRAEQRAINREGGVDSLDNKRNEIRSDDWQTNDIEPPRQQ
ncbi:MAG: hypothetical protein HS111_20930 [Kofleriaceae bacterium]|nr:hypothetical protein [Kofleriaceae bacterium]